jgi:hypothetical protein
LRITETVASCASHEVEVLSGIEKKERNAASECGNTGHKYNIQPEMTKL